MNEAIRLSGWWSVNYVEGRYDPGFLSVVTELLP